MNFDVIIGNPPYQIIDGGGNGKSALPIYQHFVELSKEFNPRYLSMIIPSRWFTGGKGLNRFRRKMIQDKRIRSINDYLGASEVFPDIGLKGGVCYFLWDRDNPGLATITTRYKDWPVSIATRPLIEKGSDIFIRFNEAISILKKIFLIETGTQSLNLPIDQRFDQLVSPRMAFGLSSTYRGKNSKSNGDLEIFQKGGTSYVHRENIRNGHELIDQWKLFVGFAAPGTGNKDTYPHRVISTPFLGKPGQISTETYLVIGPFSTREQALNALSYLRCRLTRFLIQLQKASHNTTRKVYRFIPIQNWDKNWADQDLYKRYHLTENEIAFVQKLVRQM